MRDQLGFDENWEFTFSTLRWENIDSHTELLAPCPSVPVSLPQLHCTGS